MGSKFEIQFAKIELILLRRNEIDLAKQVLSRSSLVSVRAKIQTILVDELTKFGLRPDSEPNEYGLEIEGLIDFAKRT